MQKTPHKTGQHIDQIIDQLNTRWDLQIPRVHGAAAVKAGDGSDLAKKCSSRIRALCWNGNVNMQSVVEEFEDKIQHKYSHWIWKPSQVLGTLPSLPSTKSFLKRDTISNSQAISSQRRQTFLKALSGLLEEEYKLATESEQYQRTPSGSTRDVSRQRSSASNRPASSNSFVTAKESGSATVKSTDMGSASRLKELQPASLKKREASQTTTASSKRAKTATPTPKPTAKTTIKNEKRQQSVDGMMRRQNDIPVAVSPPDQSSLNNTSGSDPNATSFTTNVSEEPDKVFSERGSSTPHSNATSFMSIDSDKNDRRVTEASGTQFSVDTEFDIDLHDDVNIQRSFAEEEAKSSALSSPTAGSPKDLAMKGPFKHLDCPISVDFPYWLTFELYRISQVLGLRVEWLLTKFEKTVCPTELWDTIKGIHQNIEPKRGESKVFLPAKSCIPPKVAHHDLYCDPDTGNSLSLTAKLDVSSEPSKRLFDFSLNPLKYEKSCRFHRRFGADRFLTIDMPYYNQQTLPRQYSRNVARRQQEILNSHHAVFEWLTTNDLCIAGRTWRAFYVEPIKSRSKKKRKEEKARQRLHLFAVNGFDFNKSAEHQSSRHQPMSLLEFLRWHLPLEFNHRSTDMKLFARIQLGLSRTLPTIVLAPNEFIPIPDIPAKDEHGNDATDGTIMTDGCARISLRLACAVWARYKNPYQEEVPSAFQARIGGAKGLWQVDNSNAYPDVSERGFWIEVRDSQLKIKPHPADRKNADETQRTFEVVKHSLPCEPGHLNIQLINIMHYCGVPSTALAEALNNDVAEYLTTLGDAMHCPLKLLTWLQDHHRAPSDAIEFCGGMPDSKEHELIRLLDGGFAPKSCRYLHDCLRDVVRHKLDRDVDKLRIRVQASTTVFCIPDPSNILAPGEIQLNFSKPKIDPRTKLSELHLESPEVLVARNPAHLKSDIQLVKAVYYHELRHLKDVAIFSTKGRYPLADLLSGGDYDGDTVTVIWDPNLTKHFQNYSKLAPATKEECGVESQTKYVGNIFNMISPTSKELEAFVHACCLLNGVQSKLGEVTVEHEKLVYADIDNLGKPGPEILAVLAGYLVDSAKQGDSFNDAAWSELRGKIHKMCGIEAADLKSPAYKEGAAWQPDRLANGNCKNIIDHLKTDVAKGLRDEVLVKFQVDWAKGTADEDEDLAKFYSRERARVRCSKLPEDQATEKILGDLVNKIKAINTEWARSYRPDKNDKPGAGSTNSSNVVRADFTQIIQELSDKVRAIEPLDLKCDIRRDFDREGGGKGTWWSNIRASCVHYNHQQKSFKWKMVGDELCTMKARAQGRTYEMTLAARQMMKVDPKKYKRLYEDEDGADADMDVEFYDAEA